MHIASHACILLISSMAAQFSPTSRVCCLRRIEPCFIVVKARSRLGTSPSILMYLSRVVCYITEQILQILWSERKQAWSQTRAHYQFSDCITVGMCAIPGAQAGLSGVQARTCRPSSALHPGALL